MLNATQISAAMADAANATNATFRAAVAHNATADGTAAAAGPVGRAVEEGVNATTLFSSGTAPLEAAPQIMGWGGYFQAIGVLLLILGALYMGLWALKRFGKLRAMGSLGRHGLAVEGQFHLGPKKSLVVVRFLNKRLLLGVTDHNINLLTETEADHDGTRESDKADFRAILDKAGDGESSS